MLYTIEVDTLLFTTDTSTQRAFNIALSNLGTESEKDMNDTPQNNTGIHFYSKHCGMCENTGSELYPCDHIFCGILVLQYTITLLKLATVL